ncbi:hypothetical protein MnTg02_01833 [bacterium MnTg02]|nr:hypothetical protein MnTg02_01833 [bacterium MnTg02]
MRTKAKRVGDQYKLIIENTQKVGEINQVRRVAARRFNLRKGIIESKWVKFKVKCLDILESAIIYDGPVTGTCRYKTGVRVRVNADMKGDIPYRLDCTDGQSATGTFAIRKTGPQSFIGVDTLKLDVKKTGKQICALKADVGSGMKSLTLQGKDLTCEDVLDAAVYIDGPAKASCPAELPVRVRVNARNQHAVGFNLKCSTGDNWNGMLKVAKTGPGTYLGVMTKKIKVKETGKIVCALRSTLTGVSKIVALRGKDFQCVARAIPPSAGGLTTGRPRSKPRKLLALACKNGTARNGKCVCKSGWKVRKLAPRRFVCNKPQARIRCVGGKTIRGRCVCPRGAVIKKARGGGIRCQCPRGTRLLRGICARPAG